MAVGQKVTEDLRKPSLETRDTDSFGWGRSVMKVDAFLGALPRSDMGNVLQRADEVNSCSSS